MPREQYSGTPMGRPDTRAGRIIDIVVGVPTLGIGTLVSRGVRSFLRQRGFIKPSKLESVFIREAEITQAAFSREVASLRRRAAGGNMDAAMELEAKRHLAEEAPKGTYIRKEFGLE